MNKPIAVLGAGHQGLAMAAHLSLCGETVYLWNRSARNIELVSSTGQIVCSGAINGTAKIERASSDIQKVAADVFMITAPATAHRDIAEMLAPLVTGNTVIVLNPGRTFGAIEFARILANNGCREMPHIAETQTIVYTCRRDSDNGAMIYALKNDVMIASVQEDDMPYILSRLPESFRNRLLPVSSVMQTSLSNVGMILHCAPVLMNVGWIENREADFRYYYDGISPSIATFLEGMDAERLMVAQALSCPVESVGNWMKRVYQQEGESLLECLEKNIYYQEIYAPRTICHRYLLEDIPFGLVPIESAAQYRDIATPHISTIITMAELLLHIDFRAQGRKFNPDSLNK